MTFLNEVLNHYSINSTTSGPTAASFEAYWTTSGRKDVTVTRLRKKSTQMMRRRYAFRCFHFKFFTLFQALRVYMTAYSTDFKYLACWPLMGGLPHLYKDGMPPYRWKGAQGQYLVAGVAVGSKGVDCLVVHTDQVRRLYYCCRRCCCCR
jgi:hypothetical protein